MPRAKHFVIFIGLCFCTCAMAQFGGFGGGSGSASGGTSSGGISGGSSRGSASGSEIGTGLGSASGGPLPSAHAPTVTAPTTPSDGIDKVQPADQGGGLVIRTKSPLDLTLQLDPTTSLIAPALVGAPNHVISGSPKWLASGQAWGKLDSIDDLLNFAARTQRVIPTGIGGGTQGGTLRSVGMKSGMTREQIAAAVVGADAGMRNSCSTDRVNELENAQRAVDLATQAKQLTGHRPLADERLYLLLSDPGAGSVAETAEGTAALQRLENAWMEFISDCFVSVDSTSTFDAISRRVGVFESDEAPAWCTGFLVSDGLVLTAKHCFFDPAGGQRHGAPVRSIRFTSGSGAERLPVRMDELEKLSSASFKVTQDYLLVPVQKTGKPVDRIERMGSVKALDESPSGWETMTKLTSFTLVPLAKLLLPSKYPIGIVRYALPGCYVVHRTSNCITHMCGVMPGGSGASLFAISDGKPAWVGVHIGPESTESTCSQLGSTVAANIPILPPATEIQPYINTKGE